MKLQQKSAGASIPARFRCNLIKNVLQFQQNVVNLSLESIFVFLLQFHRKSLQFQQDILFIIT